VTASVPSCHWCDPNHAPLPETAFVCRACGFEAPPDISTIAPMQRELNDAWDSKIDSFAGNSCGKTMPYGALMAAVEQTLCPELKMREMSVTIEVSKEGQTWPDLLRRRAEELHAIMAEDLRDPDAAHRRWEERRRQRKLARRLRCMDGGGI